MGRALHADALSSVLGHQGLRTRKIKDMLSIHILSCNRKSRHCRGSVHISATPRAFGMLSEKNSRVRLLAAGMLQKSIHCLVRTLLVARYAVILQTEGREP